MLASNSVIRRYTPPTCTLEIMAKTSPLSRWRDRPLLKNVRFKLRFDDPRVPEDQQVSIRGDRAQLELLCEAVTVYVQEFLLNPTPQTPLIASSKPESFSAYSPTQIQPNPEGQPSVQALATTPYLKARGLLAHDLFLGSLANDETGISINLSVLQLFDLATALEEYSSELDTLPQLKGIKGERKPIWVGTAAAAILAVGLTTAIARVVDFDSPSSENSVASSETEQDQLLYNEEAPIALVPDLFPTSPNQSPQPTPTLPPNLNSAEKLPPPPAVQVKPNPGQTTSQAIQPQRNNNSNSSEPQQQPQEQKNQSASQQSQQQTLEVQPQTQQTQPKKPQTPPAATAVAPKVPPRENPTPPRVSPEPQAVKPEVPPPEPANRPNTTRVEAETPSPQPTIAASPTTQPTIPSDRPTLTPKTSNQQQTRSASPSPSPSPSPQPQANPELATSSGVAREATGDTLFDNIPQIGEARRYFEARWVPPDGLTQTLEYRLVLNQNGTIQRIIPLGEASKHNIDWTDIPLIGEPFVSPIERQGNPRIRLVLKPDGEVQTFLDN